MSSHKALKRKANELGKQERGVREELASRSEKLESELDAPGESIARLEGALRGYEPSQGTKLGTAKGDPDMLAREFGIE